MKDYRDIAKAFLERGLTTVPVGADKQSLTNWTRYQQRHITEEEIEMYFKKCFGIAVLTGGPNNLECIDFDTKYSLSSTLMERFKKECDPKVLEKLYVQQTKSGGYHWVYETDVIEPNQKLACRETTAYEKDETYRENFSNPSTRDIAAKIAANDKSRVLIETRGGSLKENVPTSNGYFLIAPTPGYKKVFGSIQKLTNAERNHLIEVARSFNEYRKAHKNYKQDSYNRSGDSPFTAYNEKGDVLGLLLGHGWTEVKSYGSTYRLRRPGNPDSKSSALLDLDQRKFSVFTSSSSSFEPNESYSPSDVFIELEADGDTSLAYQMLKELNY